MRKLKSKILMQIVSALLFNCCNGYALNNDLTSASHAETISALAEHAYQNAHSPAIQAQLQNIQ